ncbi:MAG: formyltetrahydrofolate deformylase [Phycisphaeraceae bacterium]
MPEIRAVVSVIGRDQKGVVARFATYLAERSVNILDLKQQVVHGQFIMDMLVDLADMSPSLDELITGLLDLGCDIGMEVRVALQQRKPRRVAVLVSKEAHCLSTLIEDWKAGKFRGDLVTVLGNHPDLEPVATAAGLPFAHFPAKPDKPAHFKWMMEQLAAVEPDLIVLARYMQIVPPEMVQAYPYKIINIHPSLLPHFPGAKPYHAAWEAGVRVAGCTAHFVTDDLDEGPIILQDVFHIDVGRHTAEDVRSKGQRLEGRILADAVQMFLDQKLVVVDDKVVFRPGLSSMLDHA